MRNNHSLVGPARVVVTGLGATTPLGGTVGSTWRGLLAGRSGVRALTQDWAADLPVRIAATMAEDPAAGLHPSQANRMDRGQQAALVAAREAWSDAGLDQAVVDPDRVAVCVAASIGGVTALLAQYDRYLDRGGRRVSPFTVPMLMPNGPAACISIDLDARAAVHAPVNACATGAAAIAAGLDLIRLGRADVVVAGGADAMIHPMMIAAFASMRAMSTRNDEPHRASRPFDKGRDGFVLGEGAGIVVLERAEHARARGARSYATLAGAGMSADAHDMAHPHPHGDGARRAIRTLLADADLHPAEITHVNAHATGTPAGDLIEAAAIRATIGAHPVVTAPKSLTGHLTGAASAVESIATILAVYHGVVPPTANLDDPDDNLDLDVVTKTPRYLDIPAAVNNSFGFGGHNVTLAFTSV